VQESPFWKSITKKVSEVSETVNNKAQQVGKVAAEKASEIGATVSDAASKTSQNIAETVTKAGVATNNTTVQQVSQSVAEAAIKAGETISKNAAQASQTISDTDNDRSQDSMNKPLDLSQVSENDRIAFYGALFAIAAVDGSFDKDEMDLIFGMMDLEGMSEVGKRQVQSYIIEPPSLWETLSQLAEADDNLRFGLMVNLVDTAWADDVLDPNEEKAIKLAQSELWITNEQLEAIKTFIQKIRAIRVRGLDDNQASDAVKGAAASLSAVGIPIAAVYFSGSVMGLSAAGITSGLAALGLGLGMVPGIGVAVLVGAGIFMGVSSLLDVGGSKAKQEAMEKRERQAQLVIENLQGAINGLVERIMALQEKASNLQSKADSADASKEAIQVLSERLKYLQQLVAKRKQASGEA
jgi:uncharacterized tellurite resistance protein B-like protein